MTATETSVPSVPDHEPLCRVGQGSYGEVWLARGVTGALRAIKIVHRRRFSSDRPYEREFNGILKFEPVSRTHPGLVSILHVGRNPTEGYFYYVMEVADDLVNGRVIEPGRYVPRTVGSILRQGALPLAECIRVGLVLSAALAHLHAANLVHRDIKPSNIIFVDGLPKLADIGLVTDIGEKSTFVGTEGYIPPEGPGSPAADLYSLGKVLYEMSTGKSCEEFPELPTEFRQKPDAEMFARFNAMVLKACEGCASNRFGSARELHSEIAALGGIGELRNRFETTRPEMKTGAPMLMVLFGTEDARDVRIAGLMEERLTAAGWHVVLSDASEIGVEWARRFEDEIAEARAIMMLWSATSAQDAVMNYQMDVAVRAGIGRDDGPMLLPVRVAYQGGWPGVLGCATLDLPSLNWQNEADDERLLQEILNCLVVN